MAYYTILNFEDPHAPAAAGKVKGGSDPTKFGASGSGAGTAAIYGARAEARSTFIDRKTMKFYPCQELIQRDGAGTLDGRDVQRIREDCRKSKTVVFMLHGRPDDTDSGFATAGNAVCTYGQLGRLAKLLLPARGTRYHVTLIMCYGARSSDARLDHDGLIPPNALKTSFAYKFFREICVSRDIRMSAFTGAVSNDAHLLHTCENEAQVLSQVETSHAQRVLRPANKPAMDQRKTQLLQQHGVTLQQFDRMLYKFVEHPTLPPKDEVESFAKEYVVYTPYVSEWFKSLHPGRAQPSKYGKLIYEFDGVLRIVARYATGSHGENHELYRGPLI